MNSEDFIFSEIFECGKKRELFSSSKTSSNYFIHFDENNNVVILHEGIQYKSFESTILSQLYFQNGGEHLLKFSENDDVYIFELIKREYRKAFEGQSYTVTLIFDKNRLTYQSQSSRQNSNGETYIVYDDYRKTGFCHNVEFKK
jgi:tRNA splicing endonuclease